MVQRPRALGFTDRQRNGGAEDVVGIVISLGLADPCGVAAIALRGTVRIIAGEEVRISTWKRHRIERLQSGPGPLAMPLLLDLVRSIDERGENLDQPMVAPKAEGRRLRRYARGRAPELVGEDGATGRDGSRHGLDEDVDAAAVERGKPARLHERPLPVDEVRGEFGERGH